VADPRPAGRLAPVPDNERWRGLVSLFATDPSHPESRFDLVKATAISRYARRGVSDAFAEAFSVVQWQRQDFWPELVKRFDQILRG
jgi:hypothetical protein